MASTPETATTAAALLCLADALAPFALPPQSGDAGDAGDAGRYVSGRGSDERDIPESRLPPAIREIIEKDEEPTEPPGDSKLPPIPEDFAGHQVATREYDRTETVAAYIARRKQEEGTNINLGQYRDRLDKLLTDTSLVARLAAKLQRLIVAQQTRSWSFDHDDGLLDPARLARIVSAPTSPVAYRQEHTAPYRETAVTLLLDNSGSMARYAGDLRYLDISAIAADTVARALDRCGVRTEILGFTGESRVPSDKHQKGARNSAIQHIIYKSFNTPYRRARDDLGLLMFGGIYQENIDGEALTWAYNRIILRPEPRKILLVISDGDPSDGISVYLKEHLRAVAHEIHNRGHVELLALGMEHNPESYYPRCVAIGDAADLGPVLLDQLTKLFTPQRNRMVTP